MLKPTVKAPTSKVYADLCQEIAQRGLHTVCQEAACPNIGECWEKKHLTIMIMGDTCTRACAFCNIKTGKPLPLDAQEPFHVAEMIQGLDLEHVVITSVDRDDLPDGGAQHIAQTVACLREKAPSTTLEILTPDFLRKEGALQKVLKFPPDVFNHNLETVPRLYKRIRPSARYFHSLKLLYDVKLHDKTIFTKSGIMVGLGEGLEEVTQVMDDLRVANVDFLTIGQYLQPTQKHFPVKEYIDEEMFQRYKNIALAKGFLVVSSSALTRSSYHAADDFRILKARRQALNKEPI